MGNHYYTNIFSTGAKKLFSFPEKIKRYQHKQNVYPITVEIQPTEICNHRCPRCQSKFTSKFIPQNGSKANLDLDCLDSVLNGNNKPDGVVISGNNGDPLCFDGIGKLIKMISHSRIPFVLITNGSNLNNEISELILKNAHGIRVSLDADSHQMYKKTHGVGKDEWIKVIRNLEHLVWLKQRINTNNHCKIGIGFLTDKEYANSIVPVTKLANDIGVDYVQFRPYHYSTYDATSNIPFIQSLQLREDFEVYFSYQKYSCFRNKEVKVPYNRCEASYFFSVIDARGDVYICCHQVPNPKAKIGSLKNRSWTELNDFSLRRSVIDHFPCDTCVPYCRLYEHNIFLDNPEIVRKCMLLKNDHNNTFLEHSYFL